MDPAPTAESNGIERQYTRSFLSSFPTGQGKNALTGRASFAIISNCLNTFLLDRRVSTDGTA